MLLGKILLVLFSLLSLVTSVGLLSSLSQVFSRGISTNSLLFALGMGLYALVSWIRGLDTLYVFEHEFVHALASIVQGGKLRSFQVTLGGSGQVVLTKGNLFVSLAPYFVPLFSLIVYGLSTALTAPLHSLGVALAGFLYLSFLRNVLSALGVAQPDLTRSEQRFPLFIKHLMILGGNLCFAALWLSLVQGYPFWQIVQAGWALLL
ncbi:MAG TPA: hypothetical protein ENI60_00885 [Candidatus Fraserbacteria bacterium]|nr:hypothetical protein [Candidatus Fraserbacteria bacterium]